VERATLEGREPVNPHDRLGSTLKAVNLLSAVTNSPRDTPPLPSLVMTEDDNSFKERDFEVGARMHTHAGFIEHHKILAIERMAGRVVAPNLAELVTLLARIEHTPDLAMIVASNTPRFAAQREVLAGEITRHLHNFLGSASSLVDHVRRTLRKRDTPAKSRLEAGVQSLMVEGAWPFVRNLRNVAHHHHLPFMGHTVNFGQTPNGLGFTNAAIELSKADLLEWEDWSADAKRFLDACEENIPLLPIVRRAGQALLDLHAKLIDDLHQENAAALAEYNELLVHQTAYLSDGSEKEARTFLTALEEGRSGPNADRPNV